MGKWWTVYVTTTVLFLAALAGLPFENFRLWKENAKFREDVETRKKIQDEIGRGMKFLQDLNRKR
jgi:hypothetical protein